MADDLTRPATIRDVARLSGVSVATVTRTFQGSPRVRPETSARVRAAADRLGYRPDSVAQALVRGRSNTIGLLVPSLMQAYWSEVADEIEARAGERGYSLVLASSRQDPERERAMLDMLYGKRVDGVIVGGVVGDPHTWPSGGPRSPLVLIEWDATPQWERLRELTDEPLGRGAWSLPEQRIANGWFAHLSADDIAGSTLVARHLLELGHTRIAFLIGPPVRTYLLRLLGTRSTIEEAGHVLAAVAVDEDTFEGGRAMAARLLRGPEPPTALVCCSDAIAVGAIRAAHELGLDVPGDVSIAGYDDVELAAYLDPPLTTLRNPKRELGGLALDLVLKGRDGAPGPIAERLTGQLIERGSTAPPRVRHSSAPA